MYFDTGPTYFADAESVQNSIDHILVRNAFFASGKVKEIRIPESEAEKPS